MRLYVKANRVKKLTRQQVSVLLASANQRHNRPQPRLPIVHIQRLNINRMGEIIKNG